MLDPLYDRLSPKMLGHWLWRANFDLMAWRLWKDVLYLWEPETVRDLKLLGRRRAWR